MLHGSEEKRVRNSPVTEEGEEQRFPSSPWRDHGGAGQQNAEGGVAERSCCGPATGPHSPPPCAAWAWKSQERRAEAEPGKKKRGQRRGFVFASH